MQFRDFSKAKEFARALNLNTYYDWRDYCDSGQLPIDIPKSPDHKYKESGWVSWGDWLGTGSIASFNRIYRPFYEAREFARSLNFSYKKDWIDFSKRKEFPEDLPKNPHQSYKELGWNGWGNWLGTGRKRMKPDDYREYLLARGFVRSLGLKSGSHWNEFCRQGLCPADIPNNPARVYKNKGWKGMGDWIGTDQPAYKNRVYKSFFEARSYVHQLTLKNGDEWKVFCKSGKLPNDIPATPSQVYQDSGWSGMGDWLGTGRIATQAMNYKIYEDARKYIHSLKIKTSTEWELYAKSGNRPTDIPSRPSKVYKNKGWENWGAWLGTGSLHPRDIDYLSFSKARETVHKLKIKSTKDWNEYSKEGKLQTNIPSNPQKKYAKSGWLNWSDWLGT
jgi:hypothetical protein